MEAALNPFYSRNRALSSGFTLIELLVVVSIMILVSALAAPAISSLKKGSTVNTATAVIATTLEQARAYAMANDTYVVVCFEETDASIPTSQAQNSGTGRVAIQAFSSLDATLNLTGQNLMRLGRMRIFDNIDLPDASSLSSGTLPGRPKADYVVGNSGFPAAADEVISGGFTFSKIIAFDPQGGLHIPTNPSQAGLQYLEIDLQQSNGSTAASNAKDVSAIQVDGLTGAVNIYRS